MPGQLHIPISSLGAGSPPVTGPEIAVIVLLLVLALTAIIIEVARRSSGRSMLSRRQFSLRMVGGAIMILLVALLAFGVLFTRPEDGRIFGWYWTLFALVLMGLLLLLRNDVSTTRNEIRDARLQIRDDRLREMQDLIQKHPHAGDPDEK